MLWSQNSFKTLTLNSDAISYSVPLADYLDCSHPDLHRCVLHRFTIAGEVSLPALLSCQLCVTAHFMALVDFENQSWRRELDLRLAGRRAERAARAESTDDDTPSVADYGVGSNRRRMTRARAI